MLDAIQRNTFPQSPYRTDMTIGMLITNLFPTIFLIAGVLLLIYLLMGGLQLMLAAGDPKKVQGAWGKITNAVIGFVIIFVAYWATKLVGQIFNIAIINQIFL